MNQQYLKDVIERAKRDGEDKIYICRDTYTELMETVASISLKNIQTFEEKDGFANVTVGSVGIVYDESVPKGEVWHNILKPGQNAPPYNSKVDDDWDWPFWPYEN